MSVNRFLTHRVTVVRYGDGPRSRQGNPTRVETSRSDYRAHLEQENSTELTAARDTTVDVWRIFLPPHAEIGAGDQVLEGGRVFAVHGSPSSVFGRGAINHVQARLRYVSEVA